MKKNLKLILGVIALLVGIIIFFMIYKMYFSYNTMIEIYKKDNDYKVYLKDDNNKEVDGYNLYKTFGININDNEMVKNFELNLTNNNLNGIVINYEEIVADKNTYSDLNDYYHDINCQYNTCTLRYNSYYNLDKNKNQFKDLKVQFKYWNEDYLVENGQGSGQFGFRIDFLASINNEKIVMDNLKELGQIYLRFLKSNDKTYFLVNEEAVQNTLSSRLYDETGRLVIDFYTLEEGQFSLKCNWSGYFKYGECQEYYLVEDGAITKYNLDGTKIGSTKKYDEVFGVQNDYALVYQKSDNSIYVIKNDDTFSKKITVKTKENYRLVVSATNDTILIYEEDNNNDIANNLKKYNYNLKTDEIIIQEQ